MVNTPPRSRSAGRPVAVMAALAVACSGGSPSAPIATGRVAISPTLLPLPVGGTGSLTATVTDANGAVLSGMSIAWTSRNPGIATVDNTGTVLGLAVGTTTVVAKANGVADSAAVVVTADLELEVQPFSATVQISGTQAFTVVARNSAGLIVPAPPVTWSSSNPGIGTIGQTGLAIGRAVGTTAITATGGGVTSEPATLTVTDSPLCFPAITQATSFEAILDYEWVYRGTSDGGFLIDAEYHASVTATLNRFSLTPFQAAFAGDIVGTASFKESKRDPTTPNSTSTLQGEGAIVPVLGLMPQMTLILDLVACTYSIDAGISLNTLLTLPNGTTSRRDALIVSLHAATGRPIEQRPTITVPIDAVFEGRSVVWAAMNRDKDSFAPLGFAAELANPITNVMGAATVFWGMAPK